MCSGNYLLASASLKGVTGFHAIALSALVSPTPSGVKAVKFLPRILKLKSHDQRMSNVCVGGVRDRNVRPLRIWSFKKGLGHNSEPTAPDTY